MPEDKTELGWEDLKKMVAEVGSENGPGSKSWKAEGSETKRVNEQFMRALRENNGILPGELAGIPALIITTTGSKTGEKRAVPLAYQLVDGRLLIIASMAGAKRNPPWFNNLVKTPEVLVEKDGRRFLVNAIVTAGDDRSYLFRKICESEPTFGAYQARTDRVIPVIELRRK
jgi:deazaflavin-dependent oxidoreductase (nitroreductase family)